MYICTCASIEKIQKKKKKQRKEKRKKEENSTRVAAEE